MSKHKKDGFTLVELLAVIVILAVILVIAVPSIMNVITESRKGALASSAKLIASSAETAYISNQTLGIEKTIECSDISNYAEEDYKSCDIKFVDGKAKVTLIGQGKFEGMAVCGGTKEETEVVEECPLTAVEKIENLFKTAANANGLIEDNTTDKNIRYAGGSEDVKNYIKFNNEDWRIIGIFNVKTVNETTGEEKTEKLMKIVKDTPFSTTMSWDSSASSINSGYGVNQWGISTYTNGNAYEGADLMRMLNTYYIGASTECKYCNSNNQGTCTNSCPSSVNQIGSTYRGMIENVVWNTGAITSASSIERSSAYTKERGTTTGQECKGTTWQNGIYCTDTVDRTATWTGKIGLIYPSDYGYASTSGTDIRNSAIGTTNWLNSGSYWTLSPYASSGSANLAWNVNSSNVDYNNAYRGHGVRPAIYLKSDVSITSGDGSSSTNAYQISMN